MKRVIIYSILSVVVAGAAFGVIKHLTAADVPKPSITVLETEPVVQGKADVKGVTTKNDDIVTIDNPTARTASSTPAATTSPKTNTTPKTTVQTSVSNSQDKYEEPKVCNQVLYSSWLALQDSAESVYQANMGAADANHQGRLQAMYNGLIERGMYNSGQKIVLEQQEQGVYDQDKTQIEASYNTTEQTVLARRPPYCP